MSTCDHRIAFSFSILIQTPRVENIQTDVIDTPIETENIKEKEHNKSICRKAFYNLIKKEKKKQWINSTTTEVPI